MRRRTLLASTATTLAALAGCVGSPTRETEVSSSLLVPSDRVFRAESVTTADGLTLSMTYAVGRTELRFATDGGKTRVLRPDAGWFLTASVNWLWEASIPESFPLALSQFSMVVDGPPSPAVSALPDGLDWGRSTDPHSVVPTFDPAGVDTATARAGRMNLLFDVSRRPGAEYYLRWTPDVAVDGACSPVFLTSTYGPYDRN